MSPRFDGRCFVMLLATVAGGCGGGRAEVDTIDPQDRKILRSVAPEIFSAITRAEASFDKARREGDAVATQERETQLRYLVAASNLVIRRRRVAEERIALVAEASALEQEALALEKKRRRFARQVQLQKARAIARDQAQRAFAQAEEDEKRRFARGAKELEKKRQAAGDVIETHVRVLIEFGRLALQATPNARFEKGLALAEADVARSLQQKTATSRLRILRDTYHQILALVLPRA